MQYIKNKDIPLTLQLIKSDLTYESDATVSYNIYGSDMSTLYVSGSDISFNTDFNAYIDIIPSTTWLNQITGNYVLVWSITNTVDFASTIIEELIIINDNETEFDDLTIDVKRILGLVHENVYIDKPIYDKFDNLKSARLRLYSDSASVGTDNNVIASYNIASDTIQVGKFNNWKQTKI